uniref:type II toxin-antitoxin system toxin DNA ADP-ribosyl transferase DarT n=1 Tax=Cellvibrio fontiphilus TaxID=1815559 RepID=UPI002B4BD946|nr:DarT ssDNA thymidine ADP-ribosyltransferase family protein [Cellvibrio fontiphilus]
MIPSGYQDRFAYHFTALHNLKDILKYGLLSTNLKDQKGLPHLNIANSDIQLRRSEMPVTCGPKGFVHDYVPFYFTKRSPMLKSVLKSKNIDQNHIIYFAISISQLLEANTVFTSSSANRNAPPDFYSDPKDLDKLDWNTIDSPKWSYPDELRYAKQAEMLVHGSVPLSSISHIIVWDEHVKEFVGPRIRKHAAGLSVECAFDAHFKHHYFNYPYNVRVSAFTGPISLRKKVKKNIDAVLELGCVNPMYESLDEAIQEIKTNFTCIQELKGIEGLKTDNEMHHEDVGAHTRSVVECVRERLSRYDFTPHEENIIIFSAYLHDIGKGPKSRWPDGIQKVDTEHPVKSLPMLKRILTEDVGGLTADDIRRIHMLVVYDDLFGEIVAKGRDKQQLFEIIENKDDVRMLFIIGLSDMKAINPVLISKNIEKLKELRRQAFEYLENRS